ncbi:PAAR-like protein [Aquimarina latercula]|uniref:PAAR-like protein n=1 Tax=Aquimarina latercula TaxID=987 RepID=UPI0003FA058F|nr:PAAR-like protein [Aquimarina latercula]
MAGQFVKNGATLKCPLCSSSGTLIVSHTQVQLQDTPCATNGDRTKSNLVFGGVCKKWRKSPPPCASVIAPTQWKGIATDVEIDGEFMLIEDSTITCSTGGVDIGIDDTAQMDVPTDLPDTENAVLKKFLVNIRRPDDYKGEYGFDWLREEYIHPIETIVYDNGRNSFSGPLNQQLPICKNVEDLKNEYKTKDVVNPITPYGEEYYPAWLSIFPNVSYNGVNEVKLNIEIEEIEPLENDATQIIFESANDSLTVTPSQISLSELLGEKQTRDLGTTTKIFYVAEKVITIKCEGNPLENHEEIKIYAELDGEKEEVGKLMIYQNDAIALMEIVIVDVSIGTPQNKSTSFIKPLLEHSFSQAMIQPVVMSLTNFDITSLPDDNEEVLDFKNTYLQNSGIIQGGLEVIVGFEDAFLSLFNRYGNTGLTHRINSNLSKKTYIFLTPFQLKHPDTGEDLRGMAYIGDFNNPANPGWGNSVLMTPFGLLDDSNVIHELGHSLSLPHTFEEYFARPFTFYQGFTDNHMDYFNQYHPDPNTIGGANPNKENMHSFFKWQWDIMRGDKSLVYDNNNIE